LCRPLSSLKSARIWLVFSMALETSWKLGLLYENWLHSLKFVNIYCLLDSQQWAMQKMVTWSIKNEFTEHFTVNTGDYVLICNIYLYFLRNNQIPTKICKFKAPSAFLFLENSFNLHIKSCPDPDLPFVYPCKIIHHALKL